MNAELVLMGKRINMAARHRRRTLVVLIYAALAALMAGLWFFSHWRGTGVYVFWAAILVCRLFLGGYYSGGLVKPFNGKAPTRSSLAPPLWVLKLRLYQPVLSVNDDTYRNDEREVNQRDHAHYLAYKAIGIAVVAPWLLSSLRVIHPETFTWTAMSADEMYFGFLTAALTLLLTLPQAILLWTEPDMEPEA